MSTGESFGFKAGVWEKAKSEAVRAMVRAGCNGELITYTDLTKQISSISFTDLTKQISSISFEPHGFALNHLLDQISKEEDAAGRGILTALVVLKEEGIPAEGFWTSAADLGRNIRDKMACWVQELKVVYETCKRHPFAE
jgi:hypothetical protein